MITPINSTTQTTGTTAAQTSASSDTSSTSAASGASGGGASAPQVVSETITIDPVTGTIDIVDTYSDGTTVESTANVGGLSGSNGDKQDPPPVQNLSVFDSVNQAFSAWESYQDEASVSAAPNADDSAQSTQAATTASNARTLASLAAERLRRQRQTDGVEDAGLRDLFQRYTITAPDASSGTSATST